MNKQEEKAGRGKPDAEYTPKEPGGLSNFLFHSYYHAGSGEHLELPESRRKLFFFLIVTYPWKLIMLNLITILLCIPVVTIPAALSALSRVSMKLAMQGYCNVFAEYWQELKSGLVRYIPFFFLTALPGVAGTVFVWQRVDAFSSAGDFLLVAICALACVFIYLLWCYAFPLFATIDLSVKQNMRNALFFLATQRRNNVLLIVFPLGLTFVLLLLWPWSAIIFALCHFSLTSLMICCTIKPAICEHAVKSEPEEE